MAMQYNPVNDSFVVYEQVDTPEPTTFELPLFDTPTELDWASSINYDTGFPIVKSNLHSVIEDNTEMQTPISTNVETSAIDTPPKRTNTTLNGNAEYAYKYLISKGIPKGSAAGIVGNLYHENLKNPTQTVKDSRNTTAYGIAGFNSKGALPDLLNWAGKHGIQGNPNFEQQLDYLVDKINNNNKLRVLLDSKLSASGASFIFGKEFERFAGRNGRGYLNQQDPEHVKRARTANNIFNTYKV